MGCHGRLGSDETGDPHATDLGCSDEWNPFDTPPLTSILGLGTTHIGISLNRTCALAITSMDT